MKQLAWLALAAMTAASCGDDAASVECGPGTVLDDDECVATGETGDDTAPMTAAFPASGQLAIGGSVALVSDEPATIYYTVDGSEPTTSSTSGASPLVVPSLDVEAGDVTLRYFAVDAADNSEVVQQDVYSLDTAPLPVETFSAAEAGGDITLTWTAPSEGDVVGVIVARAQGLVTAPEDGVLYAVGDVIGFGTEVIFAGTESTTIDTGRPAGTSQYAIWAVDRGGRYSRVRVATARVEIVQTLVLNIDVDGEITITTPPSGYTVEIGDTNLNGTFSFTLGLTPTMATPVFNLKAVIESITKGTIANSNGTLDGKEYRYLQKAAAPGGLVDLTLNINDLVAEDVVTLTLTLVGHPLVIGPSRGQSDSASRSPLFDVATGDSQEDLTELGFLRDGTGTNTDGHPNPNAFRDHFSADGRTLYVGSFAGAGIAALDLATGQLVAHSGSLAAGRGSSSPPVPVGATHTVYTVITDGNHARGGNGNGASTGQRFFLVALDASTLAEIGRIELTSALTANTGPRARGPYLSPDSSLAAVTIHSGLDTLTGGELHLIDLATMSEIDTDAVTAGLQPLVVADASDAIFTADGSSLLIGPSYDVSSEGLQVVNMTSFAVSQLDFVAAGNQGFRFGRSPAGDVYAGTGDGTTGIWKVTATEATQLTTYSDNGAAFAFCDGAMLVQNGYESTEFERIEDLATGESVLTLDDGGDSRDGHSLACTDY